MNSLDDCELFGQSEGYSYSEMNRIMSREIYGQNDYDLKFSYGRTTASDPELNRLMRSAELLIITITVLMRTSILSCCTRRTTSAITQ